MGINHRKLWAEGKYFDLWTIPHFLSGVVLVGIFSWLRFDFLLNLVISTVLIIGWEFFELYALGIHEHLSNKLMDVLLGLLGLSIMFYLINKYSSDTMVPYLIIIFIIYSILNIWGYLSYKRRINILP